MMTTQYTNTSDDSACFLYRKSICRVDVLLISPAPAECVSTAVDREIDMKSKYRSRIDRQHIIYISAGRKEKKLERFKDYCDEKKKRKTKATRK